MDDGYAIAQGVVHPWYFELSSKPKAAEATPYESVLGTSSVSASALNADLIGS
jgi:hypothetical protein